MNNQALYLRYREDPRPKPAGLDALEIDPRCQFGSKYEKQFAEMWVTTFPDIDLHTQTRLSDDTRHTLDFLHFPSLTAIEIDGSSFHSRKIGGASKLSEAKKDAIANYLGFVIVRVTSTEVRDMHKSGDRQKLYFIASIIERRSLYG